MHHLIVVISKKKSNS